MCLGVKHMQIDLKGAHASTVAPITCIAGQNQLNNELHANNNLTLQNPHLIAITWHPHAKTFLKQNATNILSSAALLS